MQRRRNLVKTHPALSSPGGLRGSRVFQSYFHAGGLLTVQDVALGAAVSDGASETQHVCLEGVSAQQSVDRTAPRSHNGRILNPFQSGAWFSVG